MIRMKNADHPTKKIRCNINKCKSLQNFRCRRNQSKISMTYKFQMTKMQDIRYKTPNIYYLGLIPASGRLMEFKSFFC